MTHEMFFIQLFTLMTVLLFTASLNLLVLWYIAGIYLVLLGLLLLLNDGDIFVGFLWVIDLGVGLIFFIFILHYSSFLHQKSSLNKNSRQVIFILFFVMFITSFFYFVLYPLDTNSSTGFDKTWFFYLSWIDYYLLFYLPTVTDLNLLHEVFFNQNSFEFVLINFFLFYGIISSILLSFLIKYIFAKLALPQFLILNLYSKLNSIFFIRNQNFIKQQATSAGERVWTKKRFLKF